MDLNFKNVARYFSEIVTREELYVNVDLRNAKSADTFSIAYSICLVNSEIRALREQIDQKNEKNSSKRSEEAKWGVEVDYSQFFGSDDRLEEILYPSPSGFEFDKTYRIPASSDIDLITDTILESIINNKINVDIPGIHEHVPEILHNAKVHPIEPFYFLRCHISEIERYFDIVIADIGLGIKGTLSKKAEYSYLEEKPSMHSIIKAFEPMVTSRNEPRGTGLSEAHDYFIEHTESTMFLSSNDGYYLIEHENGNEVITAGNLRYNLNGVQILLRFGCE